MVGEDLIAVTCEFEVGESFFEAVDEGEELLVVDLVVTFRRGVLL